MSTGLLLFLIFMALSIIDSVARARRSQQQEQALPAEDEGDEEWRAEPSSAQAEEHETRKKEPAEALGELAGLEKLMGPGYLEKLMGPGITGVIQDEEDSPEEPAEVPPASSDERRRPSLDRDERRTIARERRTSDQERRRGEAERRARVDQVPEAEGWRARVDREPPERDRRLSKRNESRGRPARAPREAAPLKDSSSGKRRRLEPAAAAPGTGRGDRWRSPIYRELFGTGGRDSLRRAFVLKEILDAPTSERPADRRETG
ncbi:MAG: hypothetical protein F4X47_02230 [Gammaproteobacteria bacterium]|nr:hypothetical protein [Gammaproteobacteria bacterium]MYC51114.1 hypothetical protein [Gammaproteobacteria bacterium]